ncbi:tail assembly chaperone [Microbacterium phage Phonegingi]|nr:tail assembly chaperone [Microbacterium phage Phonegingi]
MTDLGQMLDFMEDEDGFKSPPMPSKTHPEGRQYQVASPDAMTGLRLNALADIMVKRENKMPVSDMDVARLRLDDKVEQEFVRSVLGAERNDGGNALDEMVADGCKWEHIKRMSQYAFTYFAISPEAAVEAAKNGLLSGKTRGAEPGGAAQEVEEVIPGVQVNDWMPRNVYDPRSIKARGWLGPMLDNWGLVELDFQQVYGIDLSTPGLLRSRTWRWMTMRMRGLLSTEGRVQRVLNPTPEQKKADAKRRA